ncbi:GLUG motif-containing protein, partial [Geofilum sp. OHC36d9]|uniref:GLUG motif-containing protein n=1 Tax=Geofilum sp. OHC36d9 TaxID=3458413 RepID=UPI004034F595
QGYYNVGGLVGRNFLSSQVNNSYSTGLVSGSSSVGGLIGLNYSSSQVNNSYSTCSVSGDDRVGGLVGSNSSSSSSVNNSYSIGSVSGSFYVGGLVGSNYSSTISDSYYNSETSGQSSGLGSDDNSQTVTALTTAQMKQSSRFTGWNFENNWEITEGISFPRLIDVADAPVILPVFKKVAKVDIEYLDTIQVVTMDNSDVTLELLRSPDGMSLMQDSILSWTPTASGDYEVVIMVSDGDGLQAVYSYTIAVIDLGGQGTVSHPFKITSLDELRMLSETSALWDKSYYFEQTADIDASDTRNWNDGAGFSPIGNSTTPFTGNYNGQGYTIDGLTINRSSSDYVGLFGYASGASIDSLGLTNVYIQGYFYVGGLVGSNSSTSQVNNSYSTGSVSGSSYAGGLIGYNSSSSQVNNCYSASSVSGYNYVGGLVGYNDSHSSVNNSYSTGSVSGDDRVGGLVGQNSDSSTVRDSYSKGSVSGRSKVGGLVGYNNSLSTVINSYYNSETSGQSSGLGYDESNSQTVTALTTAQMKQSSRFTGWDFENNWEITEGISFPRLINVADAPVLLPVFKEIAKVDVEYLDTIQVVTMDNPAVTFELLQYPDGMSLIQDSIVSWTPTASGDYEVEIMVSDGDGLYAISNYTITVTSLSGQGTVSDPFKITSLDELRMLSETSALWDKSFYFEQTANIDASETGTWNDGAGFSPIGNNTTRFTGNYNGKGYTIYGLTINRSSTYYVGLFGYASGASIDNLGLTNVYIQGYYYVGGLVGFNSSSSQVNNSYSTGSVSGNYIVGGLVGLNDFSSQVNNSYSTGSVSGNNYAGGLVGSNDFSSSVNNSYSTSSVSGSSDVGGLVGYNDYSSTVSNSYYNSETSGQFSGLGSDYSNSQTVTALTTAQMKQSSRFTGWNFENNWEITEGISFPRLIDVADAPVILPVFKKTDKVDVEYLDTIQVVTMDNPDVTLELLQSPDGMLVMQDSILNWTPTASGEYEVEIRVSDGDGLQAIYNYTITVTSLSGQGTVSDPFKITSLDELRILSETSALWDKSYYFEQTANIDASETGTWNDGDGFSPIGNSTTRFTGNYNGKGYTIDSLCINRSIFDNIGLFGYASGASIDSLGLTNVYIQGASDVGGLVGYNSSSSQVNNSYSTGSVFGYYNVGGLVGYNYSSSSVNNSYSTGSVFGDNNAGGLVGSNKYYSSVNNSYSTGSVSGSSDVGGLVGYNNNSSTISNSYYNSETSGQSSGLGSDDSNSQTVTALTTAQMKQSSRFTDWDFENNWEITEGISFPRLINVADAPVILPVFKKIAKVNVEYLDTIQVVTMDNPDVTLELLQYPGGMSLLQDSIVSWTPTASGDYEVVIMVSDGDGLYAISNYTITVTSLSGQGTVSDPFKITSLDELRILSETSSLWDESYYFEQTANIDASETGTWNDEAGFSPIGNGTTRFTGNYNGKGYTIDGLTINRSSSDYVGLFGYTGGATIDSLGLTNVDIHGENYVGGLVGRNYLSSQVNNSYSTGLVSGSSFVGGSIGLNYLSSRVNNSYSTCSVSGDDRVGGLVGSNSFSSSVNNSYSIGSVSGSSDVGGLVGYNDYSSTVSNSYYNSETSGQSSGLGSDYSNSQTVTALTTAQMKQSSRFTGWDFENNWEITEG